MAPPGVKQVTGITPAQLEVMGLLAERIEGCWPLQVAKPCPSVATLDWALQLPLQQLVDQTQVQMLY